MVKTSLFFRCLSFLSFGVMALVSSCTTAPKMDSSQILEDEVLEERICLNILSALDSGDLSKTRKLAETPMLVDATILPYYAANGQLRLDQKEAMVAMARNILDYMERNKSELKSRLNQTRSAVRGLQKTLTAPEDVRRLQVLSVYFAAEDEK